jgi:hypothetical protein
MTLKKQSWEVGTLGATIAGLNTSPMPTGDDPWSTVSINGVGIIDNTHAQSGSQSAKLAATSGAVDSFRWTGMASTAWASSFYVWVDTLPSQEVWLNNVTASGTRAGMAILSSTNKLRLIDTRGVATPVWTATNVFPTGQWVRIEMYSTQAASGATQQIAYYLGDGTTAVDSFTSSAGQTGAGNVDSAIYGKLDNSTYTSAIWIDNVQFETAATGFLGAYPSAPAATLRPGSDLSNAGGFIIVGGSASMSAALADESDSTYIQSPDNPSGALIDIGWSGTLAAGLPSQKFRHAASAATPNITRTYTAKQGATTLATRTVVLPYPGPSDYVFTLTSGEAALITGTRTGLHFTVSDTAS